MAETKKRKANYIDSFCIECFIAFRAAHRDTKFCSQKCADAHRYISKPRIKLGAFVACLYCGKENWRLPNKLKNYKTGFCNQKHFTLYLKSKAFKQACAVCGNDFYCQPCQIVYRNRKTCSKKCQGSYLEQLAEKRRAENPPTKGVLNRRIRYSSKMGRWRRAVFERDNYICQLCGVRGGTLNADHIKPFALFPCLRFELSNGRTLCKECHIKTDTFGRKPIYAKNKKEQELIIA